MSWIIVGTTAAGALNSVIKNNQDRGAAARAKDVASIQTRYSPWSGLGAGTLPQQPGSGLDAAVSGAIGGAQIGQKFAGQAAAAPSAAQNAWGNVPSDPSAVEGYNLSGAPGGIAGGSNPFGLQQASLPQQPPMLYSLNGKIP